MLLPFERATTGASLLGCAPTMAFLPWKTPRVKAPAFSAPASDGTTQSLDDYLGRYLILYFYPASFTYGCTRETVRFRDAATELGLLGAGIVGVSPDPIETQCQFAKHYQTPFPILADPDLRIATDYKALFPIVQKVQRTTFIIDPEGYIVEQFHHELRFEKHVDDALAFMRRVRDRA
jgi:thioredoxin-dependent peroxiredoxin